MTRRALAAGMIIAALATGCSSYNDKRGIGDAPVGPTQGGPAEIVTFPDKFANVANKCDGHGHRVYSTTRPAPVVVITDTTCPGGPAVQVAK